MTEHEHEHNAAAPADADLASAQAEAQTESQTDVPTPAAAAQPDSGAGAQAGIAELERQVRELESQLAAERDATSDYMQRWQRAQADFANFRRRSQQEQEQRETLVTAQTLAGLLPALDSFERAFASLPETLRTYSWLDGIALIELQLRRALEAREVHLIAVEPGAVFDPLRHESVGEVDSEQHPAGSVAVVVQPGYELRGLVLRPALVQLCRERSAAPATADAAAAARDAAGPTGEAPARADEEGSANGS